MLNMKIVGGALLIMGTSIGAGILALPAAMAPAGFFPTMVLMLIIWAITTFAAFLLLEVNCWLPMNTNVISMAKATLGGGWQVVAWLSYLLLLYSLVCAYTSAGGDVLQNLFALADIKLPTGICMLLFTAMLGLVIYQGIKLVVTVNRGFMFIKLGVLCLLTTLLMSYIRWDYLMEGEPQSVLISTTVVITAFGFSIIIPSLRCYFDSDIKQMRLAILLGSLGSLIFYLAWIGATLGAMPNGGEHGLLALAGSPHPTIDLMDDVRIHVHNNWATLFSRIFISISVVTSFLGVSLSLSDFLSDGLGIPKRGVGNLWVYAATFGPPLVILFIEPSLFIMSLRYAGLFVMILMIFLPVLMVWQGRYRHRLVSHYQVFGGKPALIITLVLSLGIMALNIIELVRV